MKRMLIYSPYGHWYLHTLYEITIAHSLRLRDAEVKFVCCDGLYSDCDVFKENTKPRHEHSCEDCMKRNKKVFANAGMPFEWLSNYLPYGTEEEAKIWVDGLKDSELFDAVYHNYPLGEWVKSSVHSYFRMRELDVLDSKINKAYRSYLYSSVIALKGLNNLLENYRPDTLFLLNGRFFSHRIALELARERSVRVIVHERGRIDNSIVLMENTTVHSMEPLRKTWHRWKDIALNKNQIEEIEKVFIARGKGKNTGWKPFVAQGNDVSDIIERLQLSDKKKVITLFTSSEDECASSEGWEHIIDQFEWIQRTIDYFARRKDYQLVIRVHPNTSGITGSDVQSVEKINKIISAGLPDNVKIVKWDEKISSYQLIELSQACLTYWSTLSLEASARGKPVMVCARGILYGYPFALNLPDANEYERYLDKLLAERLSIGRMRTAYRFGYHYFIRWSIPFPLVSVIKVHNAKLNYTTTTQLLPGKDKSLDRICDFILLNKPVYPAPEPGDVNSLAEENKFLGEKRLKIEKSYDEFKEKAKHPIHKPTVSVIVPCYNYACYLPEAVESVLNQTYQDFEIIIVNDGSPDDTKEVAEKLIAEHPQYQIRLINQANSGQPAIARNKGIAEAKGEYILPLDADDKLAPQAIELCLRAAKDYPGQPVVVYGWMKRFGVEETVWRTRPFSPNQLLRRGKLPYCSMFHRAIWELQDGYKATPPGYEDRDFWIGAAKIGAKFINVPEIIFFYRKTELTSQIDRYRKDHEWLFAGVIINHSDVFENEEVAWAADYLERFPKPPEERQVHGPGDEFPMASAVLVVNYPELYTPQEVEWAKQFLRKNPFDILKGIKPGPANVSAFRELLKHEKELSAKLSYSPVGLPSRGESDDIVSAVSANRPHPKVSIITSCYNSEKFLPECIDSIRNQTMQDWELFLLDDAGTDDTKSIIEKYSRMDERIRPYYFQDNKGPYVRRNFAIERSRSDFITIHDADDIMVPTKLEILYNEITRDEQLVIVGSFYRKFIDEFKGLENTEIVEFLIEHDDIMKKARSNCNFCCHGSAIIRKDLFGAIGLYDENPFSSDAFWLSKVVEYVYHSDNVRVKNIPECLMLRRMHAASQTGLFPSFDPRGRRARFLNYRKEKIREIREKLDNNSGEDVKEVLRNCKCNDYIEKCGHLFEQWESEPLDYKVLGRLVGEVVELFNSRKYVSCITRLNGIEKMECNIAKRFKNYDLLRALAYFAIDMKQQSLEYLNREIQNHSNSAARRFISDCFERQLKTDVQSWYCENAGLYEFRMIDTGGEQGDRVSVAPLSRSRPKVSVITSCYNAEKFLPQCIDSIRNQTMQDWELFLLDDASTDGTKSIIENYSRMDEKIRPYYFHDNKGPYVRRNFAIERANSDFIVIQDADDIMRPAKLETLYNEITTDERLGIVGSFYRSFLDEFKELQYAEKQEFPLEHNEIIGKLGMWQAGIWHGSAIIRKELFQSIGLYDENPFGADSFWLAKVAEYARCTADVKLKNAPEFLTLRRMHSDSQTQIIPTSNPRSIRTLYQRYCEDELRKVRQKLKDSPHTDIKTELKNCICSDFIEKYGHLFARWEDEPLDRKAFDGRVNWAVWLFNQRKYVSCITRLNGMETVDRDIAKRFKNYDLLRALAYFAIDRKEQSFTYLNREMEKHNNLAARKFISDYFEGPDFAKTAQNVNSKKRLKTDVQSWCLENSKFYDLCIIDLENERDTRQEKRAVCRQNVPAPQGEQGHRCLTSSSGQAGPLVSIIMPAYNAANYIEEAIGSVLTQSYKNFELIVVDDGSTDNTKDIILGFKDERIKYFYKENGGPYSARNLGTKKATGDFIVPLDADDMITPDYIARHLQEFEKCPDADLIYCDDCLIEEDCKPIRVIERREYTDRKLLIRDLFRCGFPIVPFRTCIRKSVFDRIGLFDDGFRNAMDYDMIRRFVKHGLKAHHLKAPLYLRRMVPDSVSRKVSDEKVRAHFEVLRRFTESFSYDELFPDVAWDKIAPASRQLHAKCLAAVTYLAIGQAYVKTNSPIYVKGAFRKACSELNDCLKMDPENWRVKQLLQKCKSTQARYVEELHQGAC